MNAEIKLDKKATDYLKDTLGGGSGGGSQIVDALPAEGVEGTTYLLRKTDESEIFKFHCYMEIYNVGESNSPYYIISDKSYEEVYNLLYAAITKRLNPELNQNVDFNGLIPNFDVAPEPPVDDENIAVIQTEEDLANITTDKGAIYQDLGVIGIEDLITFERVLEPYEQYLAGVYSYLPNTFVEQYLVNDNNDFVNKYRYVQFNLELEPGQHKYEFTEWQEAVLGNCVGTLTDTYEYDQETLMSLNVEDTYLIHLNPETPYTYSYTEYVFDKGVYTEVSAQGESGNTTKYLYLSCYYENPSTLINFTVPVDTNKITTLEGLFNYIDEKGFAKESDEIPYFACGTYNDKTITYITAYYSPKEEGDPDKILKVYYIDGSQTHFAYITDAIVEYYYYSN